MTKPQLSGRTKARVRQQALRQMCFGPDGRLTKNAAVVAAYLQRQCNGSGRDALPRALGTGAVDPLAAAYQAGRRSVFDMLARMLHVDIHDRVKLEEEDL